MDHTSTPTSTIGSPATWALILAVIIGGIFYVYGKRMEIRAPQENPVVISVSAEGKVTAPPDIAMLNFGVQTGRQPTAKAAIALITKNMTSVVDAVKKQGVEQKDIVTEQFWLNPVYDYVRGSQIPRGFEASQTLNVKVRDLDKTGDVLTAATSAGANQVGNISFGIDNPDDLRAQAREKAIEKAEAKAEVLADNLGMSLGKLTGFSEGGDYPMPRPYLMEKANIALGGDMAADAGVPVPSGEQNIVITVNMSYELR
ncbi:MAG: SIMPL domain-containing protein [Candidatus Peribacteraceae bacterium]|nr:SIMPL domain-containing protein [Candidatus Peribacteraceae bacterium]